MSNVVQSDKACVGDKAAKVLPWLLAAPIAVLAATSISLLAARRALAPSGTTGWPSITLVLPIFLVSLAVLYAVSERTRRAGVIWVWLCAEVVVTMTLALSLIGLLARFSLGIGSPQGIGRVSALIESLAGALGVLLLLASADACRWLGSAARSGAHGPTDLGRLTGAGRPGGVAKATGWALAVTAALLVSAAARPGDVTLSAGGTTTPLLVISLIGLLAMAFASSRSWLAGISARSQMALAVATALGVLAFTRDLAGAIAALAGGIAVVARTSRLRTGRVQLRYVLLGLAGFAVAAELIALVGGDVLKFPDFKPMWFHQAGQYAPATLSYRLAMVFGPGMAYRHIGAAGSGAGVLVVIGRETGVAGLAGVGLVISLLLAGLALLALRVRDPVRAALAWGMVAVIGAQFVLAVLMLLRWVALFGTGPPLLTGGIFSYAATMIAIGLVIGCATGGGPANAD